MLPHDRAQGPFERALRRWLTLTGQTKTTRVNTVGQISVATATESNPTSRAALRRARREAIRRGLL